MVRSMICMSGQPRRRQSKCWILSFCKALYANKPRTTEVGTTTKLQKSLLYLFWTIWLSTNFFEFLGVVIDSLKKRSLLQQKIFAEFVIFIQRFCCFLVCSTLQVVALPILILKTKCACLKRKAYVSRTLKMLQARLPATAAYKWIRR